MSDHSRLPRKIALLPRSRCLFVLVGLVFLCLLTSCRKRQAKEETAPVKAEFVVNYETPTDPELQHWLEALDGNLRSKIQADETQTAAGVLDLRTGRLAMVHPDRIEYAASVAKIGILYAWFVTHPDSTQALDPTTEHELGLMAKASSNEMAAKFSRELGLHQIQDILNRDGFYDATRGGGIWVGRHYGKSDERYGDPLADHSHAVTVRQVLRFYLLLDQGKLVSPEASAAMRRIFDSPDVPHDQIKFVRALASRNLHILRKWGTWEDWKHDTAIIEGPGRRYILIGITHHPRGDEYLEALALAADDYFAATPASSGR